MTAGFGWNFYGYFIYAAIWIVGYFILAGYLSRRDRK